MLYQSYSYFLERRAAAAIEGRDLTMIDQEIRKLEDQAFEEAMEFVRCGTLPVSQFPDFARRDAGAEWRYTMLGFCQVVDSVFLKGGQAEVSS